MGYEVAEQLGWKLPQGIIYPTGGGVGLLGMWKAFDEMEQLGFIGSERPNMISVQSAGCAPIVKAWDEGRAVAEMWPHASTLAVGPARSETLWGLFDPRYPEDKAEASRSPPPMPRFSKPLDTGLRWKGFLLRPKALRRWSLTRSCWPADSSRREDTVVLFNTGSGLKYLDVLDTKDSSVERAPSPASRPIAGIIGPY